MIPPDFILAPIYVSSIITSEGDYKCCNCAAHTECRTDAILVADTIPTGANSWRLANSLVSSPSISYGTVAFGVCCEKNVHLEFLATVSGANMNPNVYIYIDGVNTDFIPLTNGITETRIIGVNPGCCGTVIEIYGQASWSASPHGSASINATLVNIY